MRYMFLIYEPESNAAPDPAVYAEYEAIALCTNDVEVAYLSKRLVVVEHTSQS